MSDTLTRLPNWYEGELASAPENVNFCPCPRGDWTLLCLEVPVGTGAGRRSEQKAGSYSALLPQTQRLLAAGGRPMWSFLTEIARNVVLVLKEQA